MPFKETCPVEKRIAYFREYETGVFTVSDLCRRHGSVSSACPVQGLLAAVPFSRCPPESGTGRSNRAHLLASSVAHQLSCQGDPCHIVARQCALRSRKCTRTRAST